MSSLLVYLFWILFCNTLYLFASNKIGLDWVLLVYLRLVYCTGCSIMIAPHPQPKPVSFANVLLVLAVEEVQSLLNTRYMFYQLSYLFQLVSGLLALCCFSK